MAKRDPLWRTKRLLRRLARQVEYWQGLIESARQKGDQKLVRQLVEQKRHIQNNLAFALKDYVIEKRVIENRIGADSNSLE